MTTDLIPAGKLRCVITEKLRSDTPEEHVRQRIGRSIVEDYGYDKADIELEYAINMGRAKKRVDIAIFPPDVAHKQENIKIIVECKHENIRPTDRDNGVEQLKSYLAACVNATFGMWIGSELQVWDEDTTITGDMRFFIGNEERRSEIGQRRLKDTITQIFDEVKARYPYIFGTDDQIHLNNRTLAYVVGELQRFSLLQTQ